MVPVSHSHHLSATKDDGGLSASSNTLPMHLLPFVLPDFTRVSWVSDSARNRWLARLQRVTNAWIEIEWLTIVKGVRSCSITMASPEQFLKRAPMWAKLGLSALPFDLQGPTNQYASSSVRTELGKQFSFRFVLGSPKHVAEFHEAWEAADDTAIGKLLGYPACCRRFFKQTWVDQGLVDTTWPMAVASRPLGDGESRVLEVSSPPQGNILWRWMGVRAVPHLPCSFCCQATVEFADQFLEVGRQHGFAEEMNHLLEILNWPVEWSALHGIAEIKTPILKVSTRTDATSVKYIVRYKGNSYPSEGSRGLSFPFQALALPLLTESAGFKRGLENPIGTTHSTLEWYRLDNGFSSVEAMDECHAPILQAANSFLSGNPGFVLDLGCGNGALLKKLLAANPAIVPFGIDSDSARIAHAKLLLPQFPQNCILGNMFESQAIWPDGRRYVLALLMPARLLEVDRHHAAQLRTRLQQHCVRLLVYAYGDWLNQYGNLRGLAKRAGLELLSAEDDSSAGFARLL